MRQYLIRQILLALTIALASGCTPLLGKREDTSQDHVFQVSTFTALSSGLYNSDITYGEIKQHGNFGLGTFEALNGEMIAIGGKFFQVHFNGKITKVEDAQTSPFATVKFFSPELSFSVNEKADFVELKRLIDDRLPSPKLLYAIKIEGYFKLIMARSVPRQEKPYKTLAAVTKEQSVFYFDDIKGTLVGFRMPTHLEGFNIVGYHFHFISSDAKKGGHVLDLVLEKGVVYLDVANLITAMFPKTARTHHTGAR